MAFGLLGNVATLGGGGATTTPAQNTVGAKLIVLALTGTAAGVVPTDSLGNTWTLGAPYAASASSNQIALFYCLNPTTGAAHTFSTSGATSSIAASWWSAASPKKDQQNASGTASPGSITPASAGALIISGCSGGGGAGTGGTSLPGFTLLNSALNNAAAFGISHAYLIQGVAAAVNPTWAGAGGLASAILSFVDAVQLNGAASFSISASADLNPGIGLKATATVSISASANLAQGINAVGGGGGGASQAGAAAALGVGGKGGDGVANSISGAAVTYGGGGGGSKWKTGTDGAGGAGGGGAVGAAGTANRGGGGGAGIGIGGAAVGGSGVVIIRYLTGTITATGGVITTSGGYTIHTFTGSGTFTVTPPPAVDGPQNVVTVPLALNAGDYLQVLGSQNSGGGLPYDHAKTNLTVIQL